MSSESTRVPIVLAVDDDRENAERVQRTLGQRGDVRTLVASSGAEALATLQAVIVDVLVLEQRMPNMTGVELIDRAAFLGRKPPSILLTRGPEDPAVVEAQRRGVVHGVIAKPWRPEELLLAIDFVMKMRPRQRGAR